MLDKVLENNHFQKPKILISKCLEFDACRYDGQRISNKYIKAMKPWVKFIPICPEVEIGLGIPRDPIHIIQKNNQQILYQLTKEKDLTDEMVTFSKSYFDKVKTLDGFILKSKSPSCGLNSTIIFQDQDKSNIVGKGHGIFTSKIIDRFPHHPKMEDLYLDDTLMREHYLTTIFTLAEYRKVKTFNDLFKFHGRHKFLFTTYNQIIFRKMEKLVANIEKMKTLDLLIEYSNLLFNIFEKRPSNASHINTHKQMFGYIKNDLTSKEQNGFLDVLETYRSNTVSLSNVVNILYVWAIHYKNEHLLSQSYFHPFPLPLSLL